MKRLVTIALLAFGADPASAGGRSALYDVQTLERCKKLYERSTVKIRDEFIWKKWLLASEQRKLGKPPAIELPLWADGEARNNPMAFYVDRKRDVIVLPVFSLKFFEDLCTATAWLHVHDYRLETVSEYTARLCYHDDPPGGHRPPLEALRIPGDALKNKKVEELAALHFYSARTFILLHEMGHLYHRHNARTYGESVRNEKEADGFAAAVMQRGGLEPLGMLVFFMADAHLSGFPMSESTHPLSGKRVSALADHLDNRALAEQLRDLGSMMDNPGLRAVSVLAALAGRPEDLAPRRAALPPIEGRLKLGGPDELFHGVYRGQLLRFAELEPFDLEVGLVRQESRVYGHFTFGIGSGFLEGDIKDHELHYKWKWANQSGRGVLKGRDDGSFAGTWGRAESLSGSGTWTARRVPKGDNR
jgi:hypothetical protein